ncbi:MULTISPECIES: ribulose-phosphate 3-epimerase [Staphylococcus]|uniref:Ribulose-phosphate 3-epimerase n=1 Tax=Staphylococcus schleiferi TaxID=1295 RepID=A0ABX0FXJ0_STASC|nr:MULTISPECIES: ribulose-phosphate 3-epimerase [Staphylococcus]QGS47307.1 ribulose-phosphate 3-epimerase [Mammaliicoccus fleurettii]EPD52549.1 ribulose-phosphate 3-epimerase [Staphylococcus sp. HGB0015]NHA33514.1 ribulose-phosphate 3-epimerase [Staphylococcus schleiferi]NHA38145.1 ribulose-phosphate 3-epimerase [Staphylococcus schleiferi]NHA40224.1 ribulose-phosphate 3-epimerase [Staphylococcus schleiferi]
MTKIFPSLLSADFLNLKQEMIELERAGVDALHFDVMDGQFVPNISIGFPILEAVRSATSLPIDVHLMINNPEQYIDTFIDKGANKLSVHYEATPHIHRIIQRIKNRGVEAGVVINPGTPISALDTLLDEVDYVLIMSVNPGFGGQKFIPSSLRKIAQLKEQRKQRELDFKIEVDGGVNAETAAQVIEAGADWLVAGSYFFNQQNYQQATQILKGEA